MQPRIPVGVVTQDGEHSVGTGEEVGTTSVGQTVAGEFATLRVVTWHHLAAQDAVDDRQGMERD